MKIGEKQRNMLAQTHTACCPLSLRSVCVCVMSGFRIFHRPFYPETGDIKFLSKIKYFPDRPTQLSGPYVTGTKQLFCQGPNPKSEKTGQMCI